MEAVAVFGLAGTILQFIDSGARFVSLARSLYKQRADGTNHLHLLRITENLTAILPRLTRSDRVRDTEHGLAQLATDCSKTAVRLLTILEGIRDPGPSRKRDSVKAAFRLICKEDEIKSLQEQLFSFRDQLNLHLLLSLREYASKSATQQKEILKELGIVQSRNLHVEGLAETILDYLVSKEIGPSENFLSKEEIQLNQAKEINSLKSDLVRVLYNSDFSQVEEPPIQISLSHAHLEKILEVFLSSLHYEDMLDRENRIATAHDSTLRWVLQEPDSQQESQKSKWSNFRQWLESDDQLYWITGKAGSGKSTLMKYLWSPEARSAMADVVSDQPDLTKSKESYRCYPFLNKWAGSLGLVVASFYFWNSGMKTQVTQDGLFRTLLHQIFAQRPDIIPMVISSKHYEALYLFNQFNENWSTEDLHVMLLKAIKILKDENKVCFFIDGLDEFGDNPEILIRMVHAITNEFNHVKMCVASRPWNIFQDTLGRQPSLRLEVLTFDDIKTFVESKFQENNDFEVLSQRYPSFANELVENIVKKASGVFLWVDLVVASLLAGMQRGDRIQDFQRRLDELPPDLENLYDKILHSLDPFYLEHAAQYFTLIESADLPITLLQFSFADEETPASAIEIPVGRITKHDIHVRVEAMARRLNSRCKGLLETDRALHNKQSGEASFPECITVQYLHRTVRDFIKSPKAQGFLQAPINSDFDPSTQLCLAYLIDLKAWLGNPEGHVCKSHGDKTFDNVFHCMRKAASAHSDNGGAVIQLLDDLRSVFNPKNIPKLFRRILADPISSQDFQRHREVPLGFPLWALPTSQRLVNDSFLSLAVLHNVAPYVKARVDWGGLVMKPTREGLEERWPLLMDAFCPKVPNLELVQCLLDMGADPNVVIGNIKSQTPWNFVCNKLTLLQTTKDNFSNSEEYQQEEQKWKQIHSLMCSYGAKDAKVSESELPLVTRGFVVGVIKNETQPPKTADHNSWLRTLIWALT